MFRSAPRSTSPERRPSKRAITIGLAAAATLLSACGLVAAFVPPLSVGDPLGVDGQRVSATLADGGLALQSTSHLDETRSFDVADLDEDLRGFSLAGFHTNAGLDERVTLSGPLGGTIDEHPDRFTVTRAVVEGTLEDDVNGSVSFTRSADLSLSFARTGCDVDVCTYVYKGDDPLEDVLNVELTDRDELERLVSILLLRETETPNRGTFRVALEIESDASLAGYTVGFTLTSDGSKIRLGG
jgi:hypothetical protein